MIKEVNLKGARIVTACDVVGITPRTYERWKRDGVIREDKRKYAVRPDPKNKLSDEEYNNVLNILNKPEFADMPPAQIVTTLVDNGIYIASESTYYRVLENVYSSNKCI